MTTGPPARGGNAGWFGFGALVAAWVGAHWQVARWLDRFDRRWDPPSWLDAIERWALLAVGAAVSLALLAVFRLLLRRGPARRWRGVTARTQVLAVVLAALACVLASLPFRAMFVGPSLVLALGVVQFARGLPPSVTATETLGWFGRAGARLGQGGASVARRLNGHRHRRRADAEGSASREA